MKTFHYPLGHVKGSTLTVGELQKLLSKLPDEMPVLAEWEGQLTFLTAENSEVAKYDAGTPEDECLCLIFDVNN